MPEVRIVDCSVEDPFALLSKRTIHRDEATEQLVKSVIEDVHSRGDVALLENARKYDAPDLESIFVLEEELSRATLSERDQDAIRTAKRRVEDFHRAQIQALNLEAGAVGWQASVSLDAMMPQVDRGKSGLGQRFLPVQRAGVYVPGGAAAYPSSVLMNVVPAATAGVKSISVTTPARRDGSLHPAVLVALRECGVATTLKVGGAAAIAAMALGTESLSRVDKIVGPGNRFVNEAKRQLWGTVGLDGYAGPSEVCVLADDEANSRFAAADLLTQIEHAPDNAGFLVTVSTSKALEILAEVEKQLVGAQRETTMREALRKESIVFVAKDLSQACEIVDAIAPEHLTISTKTPELTMDKIHDAGCILLGDWTPESGGDFAFGPSHTLPTSRAARFGSPVNVLDFLRVQSVSRLDKGELHSLTPTIEAFGEMEGFPMHARGASIRFD